MNDGALNSLSPKLRPSAPVWRKLAALVYDLLILAAVSMAYGALALAIKVNVLGHTLAEGEQASIGLPGFIGWIAVIVGFYCFFWRMAGQTLGMRAWRLKLVGQQSERPALSACAIRALLAPLSLIPLAAGYWWQNFDAQNLTWHDRLSGTQVILLPKPR